MAAAVFAARPAEWPIARSGMCGCDTMIRSAAARRSEWGSSGRPWVAPVHQDRLKRRLGLGGPGDVRLVLTVKLRGVIRAEWTKL
jgi:hypothetical protein